MIKEKDLIKALKKIIRKASVELPESIKRSLEQAYKNEDQEPAKTILKSIVENIKLAENLGRPICQDTGVPIFYIEIGKDYNLTFDIEKILITAIKESTEEVPLRPNSVNPFNDKNSGNNTGRFIPYINYEFVKGEKLKITYFPKGAGSENQSHLFMLNPSEGLDKIKPIVYDLVIAKAEQSCPPIIIGIGIGGGADIAIHLAKKSLIRDIDEPNENREIANLEEDILESVNNSGIGPMGLGGKTTALAVHIEFAHRHPASFPLGIVFQCWAARKSSIVINNNWKYEIL